MRANNKLFTIYTSLMILCIGLASCRGAKITTIAPFFTSPPATLAAQNVQPALNLTTIPAANDILTIGAGWQEPWVRNFNPFYYQSIWYSRNCIYESLMVYNYKTGELLPWLATGYEWGENSQTLTFTLRRGVKWSDGEPFGAEDVIATFKLLADHPDITGFAEYQHPISTLMSDFIADVSAPDAFTVAFRFKSVNTLALYKLATEIIVPKHIWGQLEDPKGFANPDPVGTGPFTEVTVFEDKYVGLERILQLERNPYYWQEGKPYIQGVKFSSRHEENLLEDLTKGRLDWTLIEMPDIQKNFLDIDPSHYQVGLDTYYMNMLQLNTARPPFDNPDVRKAISMGIDRQQIVDTFLKGYITPSNASGLGDRYRSWWNEEAIRAGSWVHYNAFQANALLDSLGFKKRGNGIRITPTGKPMVYTLITDPGYPSHVTAAQVISQNLLNVGISVTVTTTDNWWEAFTTNDYDMALCPSGYGFTPYEFYFNLMSPSGTSLCGAKTNQQANRYNSTEAGSLLDEFTQVSDPVQQKAIMDKIQTIFVEDAPTIPLYPDFWFYKYNTWRFTGFPSAEDPYATGVLGNILVLLNVRPR